MARAKPSTDEEMRKLIRAEVSADLAFIWSECDIPLTVQVHIAWAGYKSMRRFSTWADDRAGIRAALRDDLGLDCTAPGAPGQAVRFRLLQSFVCLANVH